MPSEPDDTEVDEARNAFLESIVADLGSAVVETRLDPGQDLWVRVSRESWAAVAEYFHSEQRCRYFDWLSAVDWKQSPFGRSMDSEVDIKLGNSEEASADSEYTETGADGYTGGDTRFQVMARVSSLATGLGVTLKTDIPDDDLQIDTWIETYPGANWHEREIYEMFGITFAGHPKMENLYLPTDFEGFPLRKDYPLVARMVKPWPGIVDVEPMPEPETTKTAPSGASTSNPQDGGVQ